MSVYFYYLPVFYTCRNGDPNIFAIDGKCLLSGNEHI